MLRAEDHHSARSYFAPLAPRQRDASYHSPTHYPPRYLFFPQLRETHKYPLTAGIVLLQ